MSVSQVFSYAVIRPFQVFQIVSTWLYKTYQSFIHYFFPLYVHIVYGNNLDTIVQNPLHNQSYSLCVPICGTMSPFYNKHIFLSSYVFLYNIQKSFVITFFHLLTLGIYEWYYIRIHHIVVILNIFITILILPKLLS